MDTKDRLFKVKFNTDKTFKPNFKPKAEITSTEQDIYYDEIIYYNGGNAKGYGNEDN